MQQLIAFWSQKLSTANFYDQFTRVAVVASLNGLVTASHWLIITYEFVKCLLFMRVTDIIYINYSVNDWMLVAIRRTHPVTWVAVTWTLV